MLSTAAWGIHHDGTVFLCVMRCFKRYEPIKGSCEDERSFGLGISSCRWWSANSWQHYPHHFTHDLLQEDFKNSHTSKSSPALWSWHNEHPFLEYHMTLGPSARLPNHTQLTSKCITKMLVEVSHYLGCDLSFRRGKCAQARWCELPEPWAAVNMSPEDRMGSVKVDINRPWHCNLTQPSQSQHGDMQASRDHPGMFPTHSLCSNYGRREAI